MTGFSYKNFMLQIIQGSILLASIAYLAGYGEIEALKEIKNVGAIILILFTSIAFIIGVFIDFIMDIIECKISKKPPSYYLLSKGENWGIVLAHYNDILIDLCKTASKYSDLKIDYLKEFYEAKNKKNNHIPNYIFQVAKNQAFKECSLYQKDQLESFFTLYIFSRNLSFSLLFSSLLLLLSFIIPSVNDVNLILIFVIIVLVPSSFFSSYRYYIYYARILLGSTFKPNKENTHSVS